MPPRPALARPVRTGRSPTVDALHAPGADVAAFWRRVARTGTPLVEGTGPERDYTWLHRGGGEVRTAAVVVDKLVDDTTWERVRLRRVPGTDVWAVTLRLGAGWRGSYSIAVDDGARPPHTDRLSGLEARRVRGRAVTPIARHAGIDAWFDLQRHARPDPWSREHGPDGGCVASGPDATRPTLSRSPAPAGRFVPVPVPGAGFGARWYLPASGQDVGGARDVLVLLDGERWTVDGTTTLDSWAAAGVLSSTATLLVEHPDATRRNRDLACDAGFVSAVRRLVDAADARLLGAPPTRDPARTTIAGQSLGGLTALYAQCMAPDRFGASVCQSGSFWWPNRAGCEVAEWLTGAVCAAGPQLGRVHLEVGAHEWALLGPTRRLRAALEGRCEQLTYVEYDGGHDAACWAAGLPSALAGILSDTPPPPA